jgi:hypothetical protein
MIYIRLACQEWQRFSKPNGDFALVEVVSKQEGT